MGSTERSQSDSSTRGQTPSRSSGVWEWFWRGRTLKAAKDSAQASVVGRERLRHARVALELADRAADPAAALRAGSSLPLALSLYREAAYWALLMHSSDASASNLAEAFAASTYDPAKTGLCSDDHVTVRAALADKSFVQTADDRPDIIAREVDLAQVFVHGLLDSVIDRDARVASLLVQRWLRTGLVAVVVLGLLFAAKTGIEHALRGPDLLANKPWRASSQAYVCHPKDNECAGARTAIFFHTKHEQSPWIDFDLGKASTIERVEIVNREDCCIERAVPLVVEVSDDREHWHEVAKRDEVFREWETAFKPVKARYVRVRVDRKSALHLVRVSVYGG